MPICAMRSSCSGVPGLLVRSLISMDVVMQRCAIAVAAAFELNPAVEVTMIALALSPGAAAAPAEAGKGGRRGIPIPSVSWSPPRCSPSWPCPWASACRQGFREGNASGVERGCGVFVMMTVLLPLGVGLLRTSSCPTSRSASARPLSIFAMIALVVAALLPILFNSWPILREQVGGGTLLALVLVAHSQVRQGHFWAAQTHDDRTVLSLATAARHPGIALAIAGAAFRGPEGRAGRGRLAPHPRRADRVSRMSSGGGADVRWP